MDWFMDTGIRVIVIIAVAIVIFIICRLVIPSIMKKAITHRMAGEAEVEIKKRTDTLSSILVKITGIVIIIIAVITILPEFGVNIATLIAGIGVGGLAIAFAAQNLVRDFITGFFIILEDQYRIGDVVTIAGSSGTVEDIVLRRTLLRNVDGHVLCIPNGQVDVSINMTKKFARVNLNISVGYNENLKHVFETINRVCQEMADDPQWKESFITVPSAIRVDNLGDSGIEVRIMGDTKPAMQWALTGELRLRLKNAFDEEGIEIPWPHTKLYFGNTLESVKNN